MSDANEKKKLIIFLLVAYGVTYLMGIFMWCGFEWISCCTDAVSGVGGDAGLPAGT